MTPDLDLVRVEGTGDTGAFSIGRTPVTNDEYAGFMAASGNEPPAHWGSSKPPSHIGDHPVVEVSRCDALRFCEWASAEGSTIISLPTSEQWVRAGGDLTYPWGDSFLAERCNSVEANIGATTPVGAFPDGASPFGVLDLAGNVWEWCADEDEHGWAILKGGCWLDADWGVRPARSISSDPSRKTATVGFRVAAGD